MVSRRGFETVGPDGLPARASVFRFQASGFRGQSLEVCTGTIPGLGINSGPLSSEHGTYKTEPYGVSCR